MYTLVSPYQQVYRLHLKCIKSHVHLRICAHVLSCVGLHVDPVSAPVSTNAHLCPCTWPRGHGAVWLPGKPTCVIPQAYKNLYMHAPKSLYMHLIGDPESETGKTVGLSTGHLWSWVWEILGECPKARKRQEGLVGRSRVHSQREQGRMRRDRAWAVGRREQRRTRCRKEKAEHLDNKSTGSWAGAGRRAFY